VTRNKIITENSGASAESSQSTAPPAQVASSTHNESFADSFFFSVTVFLSAFLLFLIEPLFAKLILPWFGGSAAVWSTCLVFFQCALLLGYFYADITSRRLTPTRQSYLHIGLLLLSLLFLPIAPRASWRPHGGSDPAWGILGLLTSSIGLPFVLLSATSPLIQMWSARRHADRDPYTLFALSNAASLLALLSFPLLIEPRLASHRQVIVWSAAFAVFVALCSTAAWLARRESALPRAAEQSAVAASGPTPRSTARQKLLWLGLSACGSMLLLSVTNKLLEDVAPVPLLWVLPLALYLLTFALAFSRRSFYPRWWVARFLAVSLGSLGYAIYDPMYTEFVQVSVPVFCVGLFLCCLFCHGELALRRPAASQLTSFYLMVSLGGAVGAIFVGLLAPHIFRGIYELPLALILTSLVAIPALWAEGRLARVFWAAAAVAMSFVLVRNIRSYDKNTIVRERSFYGALRVRQQTNWLKEPYRVLYHGQIEHGAQYLNPPYSLLPTTYYGPDSGVGVALTQCCGGAKRVGAIGLGAGTLAAYGKTSDYFRFYEINPQILGIAKDYFSYLRDTPAKVEVAMGDARLSLESEPPQNFDVLAVDAFSGDAIPVHLLTKEAFTLYLRHLKPNGILAIHTSNTYLNLPPVVQLLAEDAGYPARMIGNNDNPRKLIDASDWVLITRNQHFLEGVETTVLIDPIDVPAGLRLWTDDYNNLFQILRPVTFKENAPR
jgi:SAM-dependent methyltransferase